MTEWVLIVLSALAKTGADLGNRADVLDRVERLAEHWAGDAEMTGVIAPTLEFLNTASAHEYHLAVIAMGDFRRENW